VFLFLFSLKGNYIQHRFPDRLFSYFRRRSSSNTGKKTPSSTTSNTTSKSTAKSSDKAPLLQQTNNSSTAAAGAKRKLVPERTVQISDAGSSRFKSPDSSGTKADTSTTKPTLTAADSGIYGADLTEEISTTSKSVPDPPKIPDSDKSELIPTVAINPIIENSTIIVHSDTIENKPLTTIINEEKAILVDHTIRSAYPNMIDATTSENEGTICGSPLQSRRTSAIPDIQDTIDISEHTELLSHHLIPFNPLHVILKKDANKYYTTEYI
jgi:hypothetical protein